MPQSTPLDQPTEPSEPTLPVYYFFYGTLTNPTQLQRILDLPSTPTLRKASVHGYTIAKWGDYPALIPGEQDDVVAGSAYRVQSAEGARKLADYETKAYEVVDCWIYFTDGNGEGGGEEEGIGGKVFVYAGDAGALLEGRFDRKLWRRQMGDRLG
ncbi:hypothetical protein BO78DRAFT_400353 [Aspergillus sclerotiicarbonarius CBS 121057]|uniref:Putative gamma-glutamylcyclotransferase n=1 Tax=Aspergillus sclerotiicarbonarius (strain CBS 121057 / IBT 28362) TaxID=1448318 RepID=A0A319EG55_ASPSB|nr:hypothetical protein BO78DRAFT_400353 [Aspergillus sclerotiicarbonarius CBS 121057]